MIVPDDPQGLGSGPSKVWIQVRLTGDVVEIDLNQVILELDSSEQKYVVKLIFNSLYSTTDKSYGLKSIRSLRKSSCLIHDLNLINVVKTVGL